MNREKLIHILLVEDNSADAGLIMKCLAGQDRPLKVHWVKDGMAAVRFMETMGHATPRPAIVLLDLNLPKMDGWEVLAELKSTQKFRSIPVLVLTTSTADKDVERAYALSANSFLVKPSDLERFEKLLRAISLYWIDAVSLPSERWAGMTA